MRLNKLALSAACLGLSAFAFAATANFDVTTSLITDLGFTKQNDLVFPEHTAGTTATEVVTADSTNAAKFNATGEPSRNVNLTLANTDITMICNSGACLTNGINTIDVHNFTCTGATGTGSGTFPCTYTIGSDGNLNGVIGIGGTEEIAADNFAGQYAGSQTATLVYE